MKRESEKYNSFSMMKNDDGESFLWILFTVDRAYHWGNAAGLSTIHHTMEPLSTIHDTMEPLIRDHPNKWGHPTFLTTLSETFPSHLFVM